MTGNTDDLRVRRTRASIRRAFEEMILEMDYDKITVSELADRAMIGRKTFYLHYPTLDDLLHEVQFEIVAAIISHGRSYRSLEDLRLIIRNFFEYVTTQPPAYERFLCSGSYMFVGNQVNDSIMSHMAVSNKGAFDENPYVDNIVFACFAASSPLIYRQWVEDGKQLSVEELIETAQRIILGGLGAFVAK